MESDTIAAVASGMTASGIGIIRISGPEAFFILSRVFRPKKPADVLHYPTHTIHYGVVIERINGKEETVDECLAMVMRGPATYTTEDTVEINTHGGPYVMRRVLEIILRAGARLAEPGEFTKRAFLGGRIDLSEAEAVMDLISAGSEDARKSSVMQLSGSLRSAVVDIRHTLISETAYIEAAIDDPEHYELSGYREELLAHLAPLAARLERLLASFGEGRLIREGILTVILGKPNAGKSSLLNALTGEDRAIVTNIEGTTRDVLEEQVRLGGLMLRILDTAGIREARDAIEEIGIERARKCASQADLILAVFDSARPLDKNDEEILSLIAGRQAIILLNKTDLEEIVSASDLMRLSGGGIPVLPVSAKEKQGLRRLEEEIRSIFFSGGLSFNEEAMITSSRHADLVRAALSALGRVEESVRAGMPEDFYTIDLMDAYKKLGEIIGEDVDDDLIDTIFSRFCMGK